MAPRALRAARIVAALTLVGFHLWLAFAPLVSNLLSRPLHMALLLPWLFVFAPARHPAARAVGWLLGAAGLALALGIVAVREALDEQYGILQGPFQLAAAGVLILCVLEMARRAVGPALPLVAVAALAYGLFGQHLPGRFGHPGIPLESFLGALTIAEAGLWGPLTGISATIVALYVLLGALLSAGEAARAFIGLALTVAGRWRAGAAKVAVVASALFGSLSGSASANVASTGAVTLPMMVRLGYPRPLAAAVEAVASTGGQIMPPLMGAGAFVMAELLRLPYPRVMEAALLPALLFFLACWLALDALARHARLERVDPRDLPPATELLRTLPFFLLPLALLLWMLLVERVTPGRAAVWTALLAALLLLTDRRLALDPRAALGRLERAVVDAARQTATIGSVILCAGLVVGALNLTGLGVKVTGAILDLSGGRLPAALALTALACLLLGMEVPTTAAYVVAVAVAGPALQELGLPALVVHMFVFWYALLSTITPPVCGTVFIAAGMVGAPWLTAARHALVLGGGLYLVPVAFVRTPALLAPLDDPWGALLGFARIALALALLARGAADLGHAPLRALPAAAAGLLLLLLPLP